MIGIKDIETRQLEKRDLGDSLQFVLKRNPRWGNVVAELIVIGGVSFVAWWRHSVMLLVFAVVGIIGLSRTDCAAAKQHCSSTGPRSSRREIFRARPPRR